MQDSFNCVSEVFFALCKEADTPVSLSSWLRFKYSHKEYLEQELPIGDYLEKDIDRFKRDYCVVSALSKWKGLTTGVDLESVALGKFARSEMQCSEANKTLRRERLFPSDGEISARIFRAKMKIARVLGPFSLHCIAPFFGWGPGATFDLRRSRAKVDTKMTAVPITVGGGAKELLQSVISNDLHWSFSLLGVFPDGPFSFMPNVFKRVDTCRVETVPKNAKTNRVIAIEPTGSLFLQKGIGGYIRERLKRVGIDLNDQEVNQSLAAGALELDLATLDMSMASDTVSRELVYELLPLDWAFLMDATRSPKALMPDGSVVKLEKFSSMGNGFTFELESLIFWALGLSVTDEVSPGGVFSVYGDDIICQKAAASEVVRTLEFVGFKINKEKSYSSGLFYESCGKHFFGGQNVTPYYQKETFRDLPELIRFHNRIVRWSQRCDIETVSHMPILRYSPRSLLSAVLPFGEEGDSGFLVSIDDFLKASKGFDANRGWRVRSVQGFVRTFPGIEHALLAYNLRTSYSEVSVPDPFGSGSISRALTSGSVLPGAETALYGNIEYDGYGRKPITEATIRFGWRWIIPAGYCPLRE